MKSSSNKNLIITFVIIIAVCAGYMYITRDTSAGTSLLVDTPIGVSVDGSLLTALNQLQTIRLDTTIFDNPVFESLNDISTKLAEQLSGRPNPFAPIDSSAVTKTSIETTQTSE